LKCHLSKGYLVCLGAFLKKCNFLGEPTPAKNYFLKEASKIIDRIKWDSTLDQDDYVVGYEDRFVGTLELSFEDFVSALIPSHRVKYFKNKKNNEVIWDRQTKVSKL
jgi:uncharacterized protein (UPF0248 family)